MLLRSFLVDTYAVERPISKRTRATYGKTVSAFGHFLGKEPSMADLGELNRWLAWIGQNRSVAYQATARSQILALWRLARELHPEIVPPPRARPMQRWSPRPWAWGESEVRGIHAVAAKVMGGMRHAPGSCVMRSVWWQCLIAAAWQTGLRRTDLHALPLPTHTSFLVYQHKTSNPIMCRIAEQLLVDLGRLAQATGGPPLAMPICEDTFRRHWRAVLSAAGVKYGAFKFLRKSAGNYAELRRRGDGARLLGNEERTFRRHYLDPSNESGVEPPPEL